eukprot:284536-Chlamydomonas_euryale.AAC.1
MLRIAPAAAAMLAVDGALLCGGINDGADAELPLSSRPSCDLAVGSNAGDAAAKLSSLPGDR